MKERVRISSMLMMGAMAILLLVGTASFGGLLRRHDVVTAAAVDKIDLPILMYHSLLKDPRRQGEYVVSPDVFEQDLAYLKKRGYTAITATELADWIYDGTPLPTKPVMITFDDAHLNTLTYGLPLLEKYDMKAVVSVVGKYTEKSVAEGDHNPAYSYLTWEEISQLVDSGRVEIGNHTFDMHNKSGGRFGIKKKRGEDERTYTDMVALDLLKLQDMLQRNCGIRPIAIAYPFGEYDNTAEELIKQLGFRVSLGCVEKINHLDQNDVECLYSLCRFNRRSFIDTDSFMKKCGIE